MKYGVQLIFSDEIVVSDDTFDTEEEAMREGERMSGNYAQGCEDMLLNNPGDYLSEYGYEIESPEIEVFEIYDDED